MRDEVQYQPPGPEDLSPYFIGIVYALQDGATMRDDVVILTKYNQTKKEVTYCGEISGLEAEIDRDEILPTGRISWRALYGVSFEVKRLKPEVRRRWMPD